MSYYITSIYPLNIIPTAEINSLKPNEAIIMASLGFSDLIASDSGLLSVRCQATTSPNADILSTRPSGKYFHQNWSNLLNEVHFNSLAPGKF